MDNRALPRRDSARKNAATTAIVDGTRLPGSVKRVIRDGVTVLGPHEVTGSLEMINNVGGEQPEMRVVDRKRHHPRGVQICGWDPMATPFWVNLVIAADGIGAVLQPH